MGKPAARLTDLHTCPLVTPGIPPVPHVGGPIVSPGVPTVMIGFLPAAVVGDMCVCVGPPDAIVMGAPTVLIGGRMAARMGDSTAHGGVIVMGCFTVLIGEAGAGGSGGAVGLPSLCPQINALPDLPLDQRLAREQEMVDRMNQTDPARAAALAGLRHDRDMAVLSAASYTPEDGKSVVLPPGYSAASPQDLQALGLRQQMLDPDIQIFRTSASDGSPHYVMSYRGTETAGDVGTDAAQGAGFNTSAYERGNVAARQAALSGESVELTGHSKGGGQAASGSAISGLPATTFNAAGVHQNTLDRAGVTDAQRQATDQNVHAYHNARDPLNGAQDNRGAVLTGLEVMAGGVFGWLGAAAVAALGMDGAIPPAMGHRTTVPPASSQGHGLGEGHSIITMIQALNEQVDQELQDACGC